jgi:electron transfer flavoprotein alpha subunit
MEKVLFLSDVDPKGSLSKISLEVLAGTIKMAGDLNNTSFAVGLIGGEVQKAADSIGGCGAAQFLGVQGPDFSMSRYSTDTAALEALIKKSQATLVLAPATSRLSRALPGVAFRVGGRIDTHINGIAVEEGAPVVQRWYYRQRINASLTRQKRPWILLVDTGVFEPWEGSEGSAAVEIADVSMSDDQKRTSVIGVESPSSDAQTIRPDADLLFVAGAGWTKKQSDGQPHIKEAEQHIRTFLEKAKASLGSSKSLVDQSSQGEEVLRFMSHLNQVGQTGSTPRHPKGLATCCHGEEPHVVGWRFINERRAVNTDANCGWAQGKADVLYVADAFEVMEELNKLLG